MRILSGGIVRASHDSCNNAVGRRFVGTPTFGVGTAADGRAYRLGYRLGGRGGAETTFELGVDAQRRERPVQGGTDHGALGRATLRW